MERLWMSEGIKRKGTREQQHEVTEYMNRLKSILIISRPNFAQFYIKRGGR